MTLTNAFLELKNISTSRPEDQLPSLNERQVNLASGQLLDAVKILLKNEITHLSTITGVYHESELQLLYHFWHGQGLTLRVFVDSDDHQVDSLTHLIPGALFYEREIVEMFGVTINGLDMSTRMFLPDNWQAGAPMRRENDPGSDRNQKERK